MSVPEVADRLVKVYLAPEIDLSENSDQPILAAQTEQLPWTTQFNTLLRRALREKWRQRFQFFLILAQNCLIGIIFSTAFRPLTPTNRRRVPRSGAIWTSIVGQGIWGVLGAINSFPKERALILRERAGGMYCASAYFMAKCVADLPQQIIAPLVYCCSFYFLVGFQLTAEKFFYFTLLIILTNLAACGLGLVCATVVRTVEHSLVLLSLTYEICRLYGSFFLAPALTPKWLKWIDVLSYAKYGFVGITINEFSGLKFTDYDPKRRRTATNMEFGEEWLVNQGYPGFLEKRSTCVGVLIFFIIAYRFVAFLGVRFIKF